MRIKKHPSGNEYILAGDVWVRNFTKICTKKLQISQMFSKEDFELVLKNSELNKNYPKISDEKILFDNVVIVSDGFDFEKRHLFLGKLPRKVCILAINKAANKWQLLNNEIKEEHKRTINAFVINNPYKECLEYLPKKNLQYYPTCISSIKTNNEFLKKYKGDVYTYGTTLDSNFGFDLKENYYVDDYRNPVCAAINLAYHFKAKKIMLCCCDDSSQNKRENSVLLDNGLYTYPQHLKLHQIIDANFYWLTKNPEKEIKIADYSSGPQYKNAAYINSEEGALKFFMDQQEGTSNVK